MFYNYLKSALRSILKNKFFSLLNICGLAIGLAGTALMLIYVIDELGYDQHHDNYDRIYRMNLSARWGGEEGSGSGTPPPLAAAMLADIPEVEAATRLHNPGELLVRNGDQTFVEDAILAADSSIFKVFSFPLLAGNPETALVNPHSLVLTRSAAIKYFGSLEVIGKTLQIGQSETSYIVTGLMADPLRQSHFTFSMLASMPSFPHVKRFNWSWIWLQMSTYVTLKSGSDPSAVNARMPQLVKLHGRKVIEHFSGMSYEAFEQSGSRWFFLLQPLSEVWLHSGDTGNKLGAVGNAGVVYILGIVALLLSLVAAINFINLSTAQSARRAREVGVRKVFGSGKNQLVLQFLVESVMMSLLAALLALVLIEICRGLFNDITGKMLDIGHFMQPAYLMGLFGLSMLIGIIAGSYPAFYLSAIKPISVLKGVLTSGKRAGKIRGILVSGQFVISIGLIICTLLVDRQLNFMQNKDLGFKTENVIIIPNTQRLGSAAETYKHNLLRNSGIQRASFASSLPTKNPFGDFYEPENSDIENILLNSLKGDVDFLGTMNLQLSQGRNFSRSFSTDSSAVILNRAAVEHLGWQEAIGKRLVYPGNNNQEITVIGVVENFHFDSPHTEIEPFAIFLFESNTYTTPINYLLIRSGSGKIRETIASAKRQWEQLGDGSPFEYEFLDQEVAAQFQNEARLRKIFSLFSGLAILVACIGLFGLSAYSIRQRTREIGIRKVVGASLPSIISLLSKDFVRLILLANLVAWPLSWWLMHQWLQNFAYRIEIDGWTFVLATLLALSVAMATVGFHAVRAAIANPVKALRHE